MDEPLPDAPYDLINLAVTADDVARLFAGGLVRKVVPADPEADNRPLGIATSDRATVVLLRPPRVPVPEPGRLETELLLWSPRGGGEPVVAQVGGPPVAVEDVVRVLEAALARAKRSRGGTPD